MEAGAARWESGAAAAAMSAGGALRRGLPLLEADTGNAATSVSCAEACVATTDVSSLLINVFETAEAAEATDGRGLGALEAGADG